MTLIGEQLVGYYINMNEARQIVLVMITTNLVLLIKGSSCQQQKARNTMQLEDFLCTGDRGEAARAKGNEQEQIENNDLSLMAISVENVFGGTVFMCGGLGKYFKNQGWSLVQIGRFFQLPAY